MTSNSERFTDDMAPRAAGEAPGYASTPSGPVRRAALHDDTGRILGHVWTDDQNAAGWTPTEMDSTVALATRYVWGVISATYLRGEAPAAVLNPAPYGPLFRLGAPTR